MTRSGKSRALRARAEDALRKKRQKVARPSGKTAKETVEELQVHQIELQLQNDELRRTQSELEAACERYSQLYDFAPCAYLTLNAKGEILEVNLATASLLEVERNLLIKQKLTRFIRSESQDAFYLYCQLVLSSGSREQTELELKRSSGARLSVRIDAVTKNQGEGAGIFRIALTDITISKQAEEALQANEKDLSEFFETAPIGLQWLGLNGKILRANQAQLDILGYAREEYVGRRFSEFDSDQVATNELIGRLTALETINNYRTHLRHKDGTIRSVLIDANAHWRQGRFVHFSLFTRDKLDQELLEVSEREQRRIAQDLHDDLGQILTATVHLSAALQKKLVHKSVPEAAEQAEILTLIDKALSQTRSLARGLHPVKSEPNGLMAALEELALRTGEHFGCPCQFKCLRAVLLGDETVSTHLFRIAQEAVTNAIKHGKSKHINISLSQTINRIMVMVEDDGVGISKSRLQTGGMGMRIMKYRAGMMGGSIAIHTGPRKGTKIICTVPIPSLKSGAKLREQL